MTWHARKFKDAIDGIEITTKVLGKTKTALRLSENNLRLANEKSEFLGRTRTKKKCIKKSPLVT